VRSKQSGFKITVNGQGPEVVSVFRLLVKKGMRVVDVGAYYGFFSCFSISWRKGRGYSF